MTLSAMPIEALATRAGATLAPAGDAAMAAAPTPPTPLQTARFEAALERARAAGGIDSAESVQGADRYVRAQTPSMATAPGEAAFAKVSEVGREMSQGFKASIDGSLAKLSHLDLTNPQSMITMMEVQLGVMSAGVQVGFATKVADNSVHGVTTLFRNQG